MVEIIDLELVYANCPMTGGIPVLFDEREDTYFYNMYQYILKLIHQKDYEDAKSMIKEIRDTWAKAMNL